MSEKKENNPSASDKPFQKAVAINKKATSSASAGDGDGAIEATALPQIIAKGEGQLAERILEIAFKKGIKVRQDKELTDLLDHFDVDSPIPLEALDVVSEILRRVYMANASLTPAGHREE